MSGSAELDDEEAVAGREELEVFNGFLLATEGVKEVAVNAFEANKRLAERAGLEPAFSDKATFKEFAVRVGRNAREVVAAAREQGVHPGYPLGRDYEGMDDVLLVAVTEQRTPQEIDRLADVLAEAAR